MAGHDAPGIVPPRPDARVAKVAREFCMLKTSREMGMERDDNDVVRHHHEAQVAGLVRGELHDSLAMQCERVGFRRERAIGSREQERIIDQTIQGGDVRL